MDNQVIFECQGEITNELCEKLIVAFNTVPKNGSFIICITSSGGYLMQIMRLMDEVFYPAKERNIKITTFGGACLASLAVFVFLLGNKRVLVNTDVFELHEVEVANVTADSLTTLTIARQYIDLFIAERTGNTAFAVSKYPRGFNFMKDPSGERFLFDSGFVHEIREGVALRLKEFSKKAPPPGFSLTG